MENELCLIGISKPISTLRKDIGRLARLPVHFHIEGERGTGKSTVAQLLHRCANPGKPIRIINALTAEQEIPALTKEAVQLDSTILIQEIEDLSFLHQSQLQTLFALLPKKPFVRAIVTTKTNLPALEDKGKILGSLSKQLSGFKHIELPPLHARTEDVPLLVEHFISSACRSMRMDMKVIDINALDFLIRRTWNENVRELKAVIEASVLESKEDIIELPQSLIDEPTQLKNMVDRIVGKKAFPFDESLSNLEKTLIERAMTVVNYNQVKAAAILNISEANLRYRLRKFHIKPPHQG